MNTSTITKLASLFGGFAVVSQVSAVDLRITVEVDGPLGLAPVFTVFHDGSYDPIVPGAPASAGLEVLAEVGDPGVLIGEVPAGADAGAVVGSPILPAGTTTTEIFDIDPANPYFQFAAMLLPSNDWFIGNNNPYDLAAVLNGGDGASATFNIASTRAYDAGTEEEDFLYSPGNPLVGIPEGDAPGGTATPGGVVSSAPTEFSSFLNIPAGFDISTIDFTGQQVARITVTNVEGLYGSGAVFDDAFTLGAPGWAYTSALGAYYTVNFPWVYSPSVGWIYVVDADPSDEGGYFFYQDNTSTWAYSRAGVWPQYYDFGVNDWLTAP